MPRLQTEVFQMVITVAFGLNDFYKHCDSLVYRVAIFQPTTLRFSFDGFA